MSYNPYAPQQSQQQLDPYTAAIQRVLAMNAAMQARGQPGQQQQMYAPQQSPYQTMQMPAMPALQMPQQHIGTSPSGSSIMGGLSSAHNLYKGGDALGKYLGLWGKPAISATYADALPTASTFSQPAGWFAGTDAATTAAAADAGLLGTDAAATGGLLDAGATAAGVGATDAAAAGVGAGAADAAAAGVGGAAATDAAAAGVGTAAADAAATDASVAAVGESGIWSSLLDYLALLFA